MLSQNLHRRHMTPGQQAAIVASAQDWARAQPQGRNTITGNAAGDTVADRTAQSGASERTQRMADAVARESPDLARQVAHGELTLPKALQQIEAKKGREAPKPGESRGEGLAYGMKAIEHLQQIPLNDGLRQEAFNTVIRWIKNNR